MSRAANKWTQQEDLILQEQVIAAGNDRPMDWASIATRLPGRTNKDCRKRWCNHLVGGINKGPWDAREDEQLVKAVQEHNQHWPTVSEAVGSRSADQCAKRWNQALDPSLDRSNWTAEQQNKLLLAVKEHGRQWKFIQEKYFPARAPNNVKNRYMSLTRRESVDVDDVLNRATWSSTNPSTPSSELLDLEGCAESSGDQSSASYSDSTFDRILHEADGTLGDFGCLDFFPTDLNDLNQASFMTDEFAEPQNDTQHYQYEDWNGLSNGIGGSNGNEIIEVFGAMPELPETASLTSVDKLPSPPKFVLYIDDPNSDTVRNVVGVLIEARAKFQSEMQYNDGGS